MTRLHVVIVNWRTAALTADCLASLAPEIDALAREGVRARVVVTDNASGDDSVPRLQQLVAERGYDGWCRVEPLPKNGGFAYGNNHGLEPQLSRGEFDFALLLNPDTVVRPGALGALVRAAQAQPKLGIAGSRLEDPDGTPQRSAFRFHGVASELEHAVRFGPVSRLLARRVVAPPVRDDAHVVDWVAGASMLARREVFEQIGLLDEAYFMYFEEVDFCLRAARAGWQCWYVPESRVVHLVGQASGVTNAASANRRRPAYWFESRRRYFVKNYGRAYAALADVAFMLGFASWRLRRRVQRKPDGDPAHLLGDFARHSALVKGAA